MKIEGAFELLSPLSHIGESISTESYLNEEPVVQTDGSIRNVFVYNGNAWRGQLRDLAVAFMLDRLELRVQMPAFHLLFSGGSIGAGQNVDLAQARELRAVLPVVSLFGGGVGNQILAGKLAVWNAYPVCEETRRLLPPLYAEGAMRPYGELTFQKSFTRTDDSKEPQFDRYKERPDFLPEDAPPPPETATQQMRYTAELLAPGTVLYTAITMQMETLEEVGALVSALERFSNWPFIGGQARMGHGRVSLGYMNGDGEQFVTVCDGEVALSSEAQRALLAYCDHLDAQSEAIAQALSQVA